MKSLLVTFVAVAGLSLTACNSSSPTNPTYRSATARALPLGAASAEDEAGSSVSRPEVFKGACDITGALATFRDALGPLNPNQPGSFSGGRREINWDAVPAQFTNTDDFPADFFNQPVTGRARGVVFSTPGSGLRTSDNNFGDLNPSYADEFDFFSPVRTFQAVGDDRVVVDFFVPGSATPALSTGFGVVFSDLDHPGSGMLRLFDAEGRSLGTYLALPCPGGISFVGVKFPQPIVARVEIIGGKGALGAESFDVSSRNHGPARDLAILDDFIYGEPIAR